MSAMEARIAAGKKKMKHGGFSPVEGQPIINSYNPARAAACAALKVAYGEVYVGGLPRDIRSHEIRVDRSDRSCFITAEQLRQHRQEQDADSTWFAKGAGA